MEITQTTKTIPVFTVGGVDFTTEEDARKHLAQLTERLGYAYYLVRTGFDEAEGRGYFREQVVGIRRNQHGSYAPGAIIAYCLDTFGKPLTEWYDRPLSMWTTGEAHTFDEPEEVDAWIEGARARARQGRVRFDEPVLCDGFGKPEGERKEITR